MLIQDVTCILWEHTHVQKHVTRSNVSQSVQHFIHKDTRVRIQEDDGMEGEQTWPSQDELKAARYVMCDEYTCLCGSVCVCACIYV